MCGERFFRSISLIIFCRSGVISLPPLFGVNKLKMLTIEWHHKARIEGVALGSDYIFIHWTYMKSF